MKENYIMLKDLEMITSLEFVRYFIIAGIAYWLFYLLRKDIWLHKKIQQRFPKKENIRYEIKYSILNTLIFSVLGTGTYWLKINGYTKMYGNISDYGMPYLIFSI